MGRLVVPLPQRNTGGICRWTPGTLTVIIKRARISPSIADICAAAHISRPTLKSWLKKSANKEPGFLLKIAGEERPFHVWYEEACEECDDAIEKAAFNYAVGCAKEASVYRGRLVYQEDPLLIEILGPQFAGTAAVWKRDEHGNPIPEEIPKQDPEMIRWWLERRRREKFGRHDTLDVKHSGGVLVVGAKLSTEELEKKFGGVQEPVDVEFEEVDDGAGDGSETNE